MIKDLGCDTTGAEKTVKEQACVKKRLRRKGDIYEALLCMCTSGSQPKKEEIGN